MSVHASLAAIVDDAALKATAVEQLTLSNPDLDGTDGYTIQAQSIRRRLERGERPVGLKLGLTSRAKMQQVNVNEVIVGRLTDAMQISDGGEVSIDRFIHPRIEPEIAFLLRRRLEGKVSLAEAAAAVEAVMPGLEIIDSRYIDFKFTLPDVVADNTSAAGFVLGPPSPLDRDIGNLAMTLNFNGRPVQIGSSAAILGHPLRALVEAARLAEMIGASLEAGSIVLAGAATAAVELKAGVHVTAQVSGLGRAAVTAV
ncbi:MAG: fumarylacetoacetate hydrolase family protein [Rhizobiaceae bacterium]|nr:fumarylacetoacetate hydrolase family protein [Rhizobiaceae bacterium]